MSTSSSSPKKSVLIAQNLVKYFKVRKVVDAVSLTVNSGEVIGLLGPNGAGKTTCFHLIVGLIKADSGSISINEKDITVLPIHHRALLGLGYLPQEPSIFRKLTVAENILAILQTRQELSAIKARETLDSLLNEFRIDHLRNNSALSLSGGERRRLEIARALAVDPKFILLDEPFAGVDPISVNDIQKIITHLCQRGIGILITDHNVRETLKICNRAYIINEGKLLAQGSPEEVLKNDEVKNVYLGHNFHM